MIKKHGWATDLTEPSWPNTYVLFTDHETAIAAITAELKAEKHDHWITSENKRENLRNLTRVEDLNRALTLKLAGAEAEREATQNRATLWRRDLLKVRDELAEAYEMRNDFARQAYINRDQVIKVTAERDKFCSAYWAHIKELAAAKALLTRVLAQHGLLDVNYQLTDDIRAYLAPPPSSEAGT